MNCEDDDEVHDFKTPKPSNKAQKQLDDVQKSLCKEVSIFNKRERLLQDFKVIICANPLFAILVSSRNVQLCHALHTVLRDNTRDNTKI